MIRPLLFLLFCIFASCSKSGSESTEKTALTGTWKLSQTLAGSGTWQPAADPLVISFHAGGALSGNAFPQAERYDVASISNLRFTFTDGTFIFYNYALTGTTLELSGGGCIEACGAKFVKISDQNQ